MTTLNNNYLINKLEDGRKLKFLFISDSTYWHHLQKINSSYENCHVEICGNGTPSSLLETRIKEDDCDFIINYNSDFYNQDKFSELEGIASRVSEEYNKRVSIGYSYVIPEDERESKNIKEEIKFVSFKNGDDREELTFGMGFFVPLDLAEITVATHDYLETQKCIKKI